MWRCLAFVGTGLFLAGCDVYDASLIGRDAGTAPVACEGSIEPPPRPAIADDGTGDELVYALRDVVFDQSGERWASIGYNLDGLCSVPPDPVVECRPPVRTASPETDGNGGIDNAFGHHLFPVVELTVPGLEETARGYQGRGVGAIVMRLRGWNGRDDDPRVDVTAAVTVFATSGDPGDTAPPVVMQTPDGPVDAVGEPLPEPVWDGNDWFWARSDNFFEGSLERPLVRDDNAYVSGGTLVVRLPERTDFIFPGEEIGLLVRLTGAVATATFNADRTLLTKVTVAGRWPVIDLLMTAEAVGVCRETPQYDILSNLLDRIADVRSRAGTGGEDVTCDAVSIGLDFTGMRARLAGLAVGAPVPDACDPTMMTPDAGPPPDAGP